MPATALAGGPLGLFGDGGPCASLLTMVLPVLATATVVLLVALVASFGLRKLVIWWLHTPRYKLYVGKAGNAAHQLTGLMGGLCGALTVIGMGFFPAECYTPLFPYF